MSAPFRRSRKPALLRDGLYSGRRRRQITGSARIRRPRSYPFAGAAGRPSSTGERRRRAGAGMVRAPRLRDCRRRRRSGAWARALLGGAGRGAGLRRRRGRPADELGKGRHRLGMPVFLGIRPALVRFRPMPFGFRPAPISSQHADTENPDTQGRNGRGRGGSEGSLRRHSGSGEAGHLIFVHAGEAIPARPGTARGRPTPREGRRDAGGGPGGILGEAAAPRLRDWRPGRAGPGSVTGSGRRSILGAVFEAGATVRTPPPRGNAPRCGTDSIAAGGGDKPPARIRATRDAEGSPRIRRGKVTTATLSAFLPPPWRGVRSKDGLPSAIAPRMSLSGGHSP